METRTGTLRYDLVFGLLMLATAALAVRHALLVSNSGPDEVNKAEIQQRMILPLPARPGSIFARTRDRWVLMAASKQVPSCYGDPHILPAEAIGTAAADVAAVLGLETIELQERLISRKKARFIWLKRGITAPQAQAVRNLRIRAVGIAHEWRRVYPNGQLGSAVVGFCHRDGAGGGGMELYARPWLRSADGRWTVLADAARRPIWPVRGAGKAPRDGDHVFLCLDAVIQGCVEKALAECVQRFAAKWATGIVVEPDTGRILAMCSVPTFDPNAFTQYSAARRTNRAAVVPYEPGSVTKPLFAAAAVDAGLVSYDTPIFCENGAYRAHRGGRITDHGRSYGLLSVGDVVVFSSNIGMAKIGEKLGNARLWAAARRFGFGCKTGIELPGESVGIVRDAKKWDGYSMRRVPFGQEISVTSIQLAMAFCSLVNGGLLLRPRLIDFITDPGGRAVWRSRRQVVRRVLSPRAAAQTLDVLGEVVRRGTGKRCRLRRWRAFGKTGTAQIPGRGGYVDGAYTASFVGGAPLDSPKVLCLISVYWPEKSRGYYGSVVAAPYVKEILQQTLSYIDVPPTRVGAPSKAI